MRQTGGQGCHGFLVALSLQELGAFVVELQQLVQRFLRTAAAVAAAAAAAFSTPGSSCGASSETRCNGSLG